MATMKPLNERKHLFLSALRESQNVSKAARSSGLSRRSAYRLRDDNADFARGWADALTPTLPSPSETQERPNWGAQVLALMDDGHLYEHAVKVVAEHANRDAMRDATKYSASHVSVLPLER